MDTRRTAKPRQIRGKLTAGLPDIERLKGYLSDFAEDEGFHLTYEDLKRRGDHGPLHDYNFGLTQTG